MAFSFNLKCVLFLVTAADVGDVGFGWGSTFLVMICQWHESPLLTISCTMVDGGFSMVFRVLKFGEEMRNRVLKISFLVQ